MPLPASPLPPSENQAGGGFTFEVALPFELANARNTTNLPLIDPTSVIVSPPQSPNQKR
jgi:hypothetical protein